MVVASLGPRWAQQLLTPYGLVHTIGVMGHAKSVTLVPFHGIELPGYWVARCHLQMYLSQLSGPPFSSPVSDPIYATGYLRQWFGREDFGVNHFTVITHNKKLYVCVTKKHRHHVW